MSISRTSSGGVRSLRAMFESSKTSTSDSQSLTPGDNRTNEIDTPRSAPKVRASFVPVESNTPVRSDSAAAKDNINGHNSTADQRRESFSLDEAQDAEDIADLQRTVTHEKEKRKQSADVREVVPEQAIEPTPAVTPAHELHEDNAMGSVDNLGNKMQHMDLNDGEAVLNTLGLPKANSNADLPTEDTDVGQSEQTAEEVGSPAESPGDNPDKPVSAVEDTDATMKPADPKDEGSVSGGAALPPPAEKLSPLKHNKGGANQAAAPFGGDGTSDEDPPAPTPGKTLGKVNGIAKTPMHSQAKPTPSKTPSRPPAISTAREASTKATPKTAPMPKSPAGMPKTPKTPTSVHQASPPKSAVSKPSPKPSPARTDTKPQAPAPKTSRSSLRASTSSTATAPTAASKTRAAAKPNTSTAATTHTSPTTSKPTRPKSPTRPVRLPSHLTAPTASSAAKHDATGGAPTRTAASSTTAAGSTLGRKPSTLTRDRGAPSKPLAAAARKETTRPSLNASQSAPKRPESRTGHTQSTKAPDEGFLARMMRPTASSSSKAHDKVEAKSPPRRAASIRPKQGGAGAGAGRARERAGDKDKDREGVKTNGIGKEGAPVLPDVAGVDATGGADDGGMGEVDGVGAR